MSAQPSSTPPDPQPLADSAADSLTPQLPSQNLDSDITDELTDYLTLSARDLQLAGHAPDEAQKLAHQKFGDLTAIRRRLWWIQKGDEIMLRTAVAVVLVVLVMAVVALGIGGWQVSQTMNELGDTLATMNETQRALLASRAQEDRPLAIRGRLYRGDKSKPASYATVDLYPLPGGKMVDTLVADENGRFGTSSLEAGHYTLVVRLVPNKEQTGTPPHPDPEFYVQSRPISVYPWSKDTTVELDVAMIEYGRVTFELTRPFPQKLEIDLTDDGDARKAIVYPALALAIPHNKQIETLPIRRLSDSPQFDWPVIGIKGGQVSEHALFDATTVLNYGEYPTNDWWPVGKPIAFPRLPTIRGVFPAARYQIGAYMTFSYSEVSPDALLGESPAVQIVGESNLTTLPEESRASFEVADQRRTHLRITPPGDLEQTLREMVAQTDGDEKKIQELQRKPFAVKVEVVGQMDLFDPQEWSPPSPTGYGGYGASAGGYGGAR